MQIIPWQNLQTPSEPLCQLVYDTLPPFYELIPGNHKKKLQVIAAQLRAPKSEISQTWVAMVDGEIAGCVCCYLSDEMAARQFNGITAAFALLSATERIQYLNDLKAHTGKYPTLPPDSLYISRLAIYPKFHSHQTSAHLMNFAVDRFKDIGRYAGYIAQKNIRSLKYTEKFGFGLASAPDLPILLVLKGYSQEYLAGARAGGIKKAGVEIHSSPYA